MGASEHQSKRASSRTWKIFQKKKDTEDTQPIVYDNHDDNYNHENSNPNVRRRRSLATIARTSLLTLRRLRLDPDKKLYFIYEPGRQVSSAVRIKNVSRSYVAFKFQTNAPKSCFMRPPNGILAPKESILASVVKFVELPEQAEEKKTATKEKKTATKDKFKIVTLKVKQGTEYSHELFEEQRDLLFVERVLRVAFLDPERPCKQLDKLKKMLDEAEAIKQAEKKSQDDKAEKPGTPPEGIIDEWKERREKYLARQQEGVGDSF